MQHNHSVYDTDTHFVIDPVTRAITNANSKKNTLIQFDHNSEVFDFEIPRYVDGHDMLLCNEVKVHYINIDAKSTETQNKGTYEVKDYGVLESNPDTAVFSWLISDNATQLVGALNFLITFCCVEDGKVLYRWSTGICQTVSISSGMYNGEAVVMEYPDILAQWKAELFEAGGNAVVNVTTAEANALAAIEAAGEAKKQSVLESIPDEYEALSALADSNYRNKAGAIVLKTEGESIVLSDASEYPLQNLKLFGRSTQDGTPTPDAPVDIVSVENPLVAIYGKNLLPCVDVETVTRNGITFTAQYDRLGRLEYISASGTATALSYCTIAKTINLPNGDYILSGCPNGGGAGMYDIRFNGVDTRDGGESAQFTITEETVQSNVTCVVASGVTVTDLRFKPMVRLASVTDATYEPYIETKTVKTSHTLPGIPVSSGGNYTDANGQRWICDEVDLARGVYVQRVGVKKLTGTEAFEDYIADNNAVTLYLSHKNDSDFICTHAVRGAGVYWANTSRIAFRVPHFGVSTLADFKNFVIASYNTGTPVVVYYMLATPIETPLSDAEITAFKALHTNKPNTTILNDAGAHMAVSYVADTKTYIDNKIKEYLEGVTE